MSEQTESPTFSDEELEFLESIFELARQGATEQLTTYINSGVPVNLTNAKGDSLLILAAYYRHADTVRALLAAGADTNRVNDMGQTALSSATFRNDAEIVKLLLDAGGDPMLGPTNAVAVARQFELSDMYELLTERGTSGAPDRNTANHSGDERE